MSSRQIWILAIALSLTAPGLQAQGAAPKWFVQQSLQQQGYIIGYGQGQDVDTAKANARADLAKQMHAKVQTTSTQNTQMVNGQVKSQAQRQINESSQAELSDLEVIRSRQESSGIYYIALGMDQRPLSQRILAHWGQLPPANQPSLLHNTPLWQSLTPVYGYNPQLQLISQNNRYYLAAQGKTLAVKPSEVVQLFPAVQSAQITFQLISAEQMPISTLQQEQLYRVDFRNQTPGFLTYVQVFEKGDSLVLFANQKLNAQQGFIYPDAKLYEGLTAELPPQQNKTQDLHLAILCPTAKDFSTLETISIHSPSSYNKSLEKLPGLVQNCQVTSQIVSIR